jgi:hypothetical protein
MNVEKTHMQHMRSGILVPGRRDTIFRSLNKNNLKKKRVCRKDAR